MKKLSLKKIILGTSLLSLSFIAMADHWCEFCKREHGEVCPYASDREDRDKVINYKRSIAFWGNFGEFLKAEEIIDDLIEDIEKYCTYPIALAIQDVLFDNGQKYGYYWQKRNAPKDVYPSPPSFGRWSYTV